MKLPIKLTWEDDEWIFRDADDVRIGGMDAMMDLVGDLVVQRDALIEALSEMTSWIADGWPLDEWADDHPLTAPSTAGELRRALAALALAKGENATA